MSRTARRCPRRAAPWLSCSTARSTPWRSTAHGTRPSAMLVRRVPAQEGAQLVGEAHLGERRTRERAVADPRAAVAARARLDARALAVHEDPGERRAQGLLEGRRRRAAARSGCARAARARRAPPRARRASPQAAASARARPAGGGGVASVAAAPPPRRVSRAPAARRRSKASTPSAKPSGSSIAPRLRQPALEERREPLVRARRRRSGIGRGHGDDHAPRRSRARARRRTERRVIGATAPHEVQALPRRRHLERADRDEEAHVARRVRPCSRSRSARRARSRPAPPAAKAVTRARARQPPSSTDGIGRQPSASAARGSTSAQARSRPSLQRNGSSVNASASTSSAPSSPRRPLRSSPSPPTTAQ